MDRKGVSQNAKDVQRELERTLAGNQQPFGRVRNDGGEAKRSDAALSGENLSAKKTGGLQPLGDRKLP